MQVKKDIMWRINGSFILLCLMGMLIIVQIVRIQFNEKNLPKESNVQIVKIEASRGNIFSSDGSLMATSIPIYDIHIDPIADGLTNEIFNHNIDSLGICLSQLFKDHSPAEYRHAIRIARSQNDRYFLLKRNVTYTELQKLKTFPLFRLGRYKGGLRIEQREKRELIFKDLASRTLGNVRENNAVGIEASFDSVLKGIEGKRVMQMISGNVWMPVTDKDVVEPKDGNDVVTTLDVNIQDVAENALRENLIFHKADHGCAVLMEVSTGEVKAIANLSRTKNGDYIEDFNYVIGEATEPGSTMKMASLLAAMDDGLVEPNDTINVGDGNYNYFGRQLMKDSHPPHSSRLSIEEAFETSSNVGISKTIWNAYAKRPQQFINKLKSFGLGQKLGLEIEGEGIPEIKNTSDKFWTPFSLPWMSIGYELKLTPLQILAFYNAIANNGKMVMPHFVKEIRNHGKLIHSFPIEVIRDSIASNNALAKARKMMEGVVEKGTASSLKTSPFKIAGKTGTAQINKIGFGYDINHRSYQASFVGYFPAEAPKYSCMVVVYSPSNNVYFGGAVAAPIFKEIAEKVYSNRIEMHGSTSKSDSEGFSLPIAKSGQQKELKKILASLDLPVASRDDEAENVLTKISNDHISLTECKSKIGIVPDVSGMSVKDAVYMLENSGMRVNCSGRGFVTRQSISPGEKITKGQVIFIELNL